MLAKRIIPCLDVTNGRVVKGTNFVDLVDENNEIVFRFYPDGEAVGPIMKLQIGDMEFHVSVDRLKGQLVMYEIERL